MYIYIFTLPKLHVYIVGETHVGVARAMDLVVYVYKFVYTYL